jgi:hypothetical protein
LVISAGQRMAGNTLQSAGNQINKNAASCEIYFPSLYINFALKNFSWNSHLINISIPFP